MTINRFVLSLLPNIERKMIDSDIARLRNELTSSTIPSFDAVKDTFKNWDFKDEYNLEMDKVFSKYVKSRFRGNFIIVTGELMKRCLENLNIIEKQLNSDFGSDVVRSALTYSRVQVLQLIETVDFVSKYSRLMLIHAIAVEIDVVSSSEQKVNLTNAQRKWLSENKEAYIRLMNTIDRTPKEIDKLLKAIPDVEVDETNAVVNVVGASKLDPLTLSLAVRNLNPIYHIRMAWEDWMHHRLELAKEERQAVEYQLMDLKNQSEGRNDPKLDKAIEYTQDRIKKLTFKIAKLEER